MTVATTDGAPLLYIGTRKGLFLARFAGDRWTLSGPRVAGYEIMQTFVDPADPLRVLVSARHPIWGAHLYRSQDGGQHWEALPAAPAFGPGAPGGGLRAVWGLARAADGRLYAGIDPAGLFYSDDEAASWHPVTALNEHPTRTMWEPARGGYSIHSIRPHPQDPDHLLVAVSAGGVYRTDDGGRSWMPCNDGIPARNLAAANPPAGHNVHRLLLHPRQPDRLYRQCYHGTWRSDDGGRSWQEITAGLPGDFGYAITLDPHDPDTLFQIPESDSHMRSVVDGRLRVYVTRDAGGQWLATSDGLPQQNAWVTVLREAFDTDEADPCGLYFGTSSGHVFASLDGGGTWQRVAELLPRVLSLRAVRVGHGGSRP